MTVTLVRAFSGLVHDSDCPTMRGRPVYKVVAPDLPDDEVSAFLAWCRLDACGTCLSTSKPSHEGRVSATKAIGRGLETPSEPETVAVSTESPDRFIDGRADDERAASTAVMPQGLESPAGSVANSRATSDIGAAGRPKR